MTEGAKLKLLHVASSHLIGLTNQETQLAHAYQALGHVDICVVSGENEQISGSFCTLGKSGIPVAVIQGFDDHRHILKLANEFKDVLKRFKPDIVSVNTNWQLLIAALARLSSGSHCKFVYTIHGFRHNHRIKSVIARLLIGMLLFLFADMVNAPSFYVRDKFSWLKYKIQSIPLGEDNLFFQSAEIPDLSTPLSFCFPGQFREGKNQLMLIEAFSEYVRHTNNTQAFLVLPGTGELLSPCKHLVSTIGIAAQVVFPGQLDRQQMLEVYQRCQVAVVPTNSETFGHCIAEPLVMKRILLTRPVGIAPDVIVHGFNGFLFNTKTDLVQLMIAIHSMDKSSLMKISVNAGETGRQFSWSEIAKRNVDILMKPLLTC